MDSHYNIIYSYIVLKRKVLPRLTKISLLQIPGRVSFLVHGIVIGDHEKLRHSVVVFPAPASKSQSLRKDQRRDVYILSFYFYGFMIEVDGVYTSAIIYRYTTFQIPYHWVFNMGYQWLYQS